MASRGKKKTTMAKLDRERRMRERRLDKQARKDARKHVPAGPLDTTADPLTGYQTDEPAEVDAREPTLLPVGPVLADR